MKKIIIAWVLLTSVVSVQAQVDRWSGAGSADYMDGTSWADGSVPTSSDTHALMGTVYPMPILSTAVGSDVPAIVGIGWDESYGELTIANGGSMNAANVYVGWGSTFTSTGQLTIATGGSLTATSLNLGNGGDNRGRIYMTGGLIYGNSIQFGDGAYVYMAGGLIQADAIGAFAADTHIDMGGDAVFLVNGDFTGAGLVGINIFPIDAGSHIIQRYDPSSTRTEFRVARVSENTIAHWSFEEGVDGQEHAGDKDDFYLDLSGNENHLSSWWDKARPRATSDCPFSRTPAGVKNSLALDFDFGSDNLVAGVSDDAFDDIGTFGNGGGKMINSYSFANGWTAECSFKIRNNLGWHVLVGKDGKPTEGGEAPFWLKIRGDNGHLEVMVLDDNLNIRSVPSISPIELDTWHSVAATYDNSTLKLYLKKVGETDYTLQGSLPFTDKAQIGIHGSDNWTVGRGAWGGNPSDYFCGLIDEVRMSDIALDPAHFMNSDIDIDSDGMADSWEIEHFGNIAGTPENHSDADGISDGLEYVLGGDPNVNDANAITPSYQFVNADTWEQVYNRRTDTAGALQYATVYKTDLTDPNWASSAYLGWEIGSSALNAEVETVTNHIPVAAYDQFFTKIESSVLWRNPTVFSQVANPSPFDSDFNAIDDGILSWDAATGATSYDVYISTNEALVTAEDPSVFVINMATTSGDASALLSTYTTYYWKVVPVASDPNVVFMPSPVWSFKQTIPASLGRGHQLVLKRGFLNGTMVFAGEYGFDWGNNGSNVTWSTWVDLQGNLVDCHGARFNSLTGHASPPDINYSRWCENVTNLLNGTGNALLDQWEIFYIGGIKNLAMLQATDEQDLSNGSNVTAIKAGFDRWKAAYPNTIVHANIIGTESHFYNGYDNFMKTAKPDMNMVDAYEFNGNGGTLDKHYYALTTMRDKGKIGIGATAYTEPIPNGMWYQCFNQSGHQQTQTEVCLAMYSPLAYGFKALKGWVYSHNEPVSTPFAGILFSGNNDTAADKTVYFDIVTENNRQINLMGDTLVRLSHEGTWDVNDESGNIPAFSSGDVPNITGISASDDVVISKFLPLHEDFDGSSYSSQTYFFLLNGNAPWADTSKTPANTAQTITLTIGGGITNLEAIDLSNGAGAGTIETIPVTGGTVDITLDGGRGKLFKFQTGAPFVGFYNGE